MSALSGCYRYGDKYFDKPKDACSSNPGYGNPIYPLTGVKRQEVELGIRIAGQPLTLSYDSRSRLPGAAMSGANWQPLAVASFGPLWQSSLHKSLVLQSASGPGSAYSNVLMHRGGGVSDSASVAGFDSCGGSGGGGAANYRSQVEPARQVIYTGTAGRLVDGRALSQETYDASGALLNLAKAQGGTLSYTYSDANTPASMAPAPGLLIQVADHFGRSVQFTYEQPANPALTPRIRTIADATGQVIQAGYDTTGNLISLTWPGTVTQTLLYERADLPWALTGIIDQNNKRHATYGYDAVGRANSTELAGGVNRYSVQYAAAGGPQWSVTEVVSGDLICREHRWTPPTGTVLTMSLNRTSELGATTQQGMVALTSQSQPAGSGCAASATAQGYDGNGNGNVTVLDDMNGNRTCHAYDSSRNLRIVTLSGLSNSTACPGELGSYIPSGTDVTNPQRKVSTQWHPDWVLQTKTAEPGRITTSIYNGQPDPFNGGAAASCAPTTALLPDGKPIAVLCKQVEQATTDANGALGFSAPLQPGVANRVSTWTYNQYGQVLTENGPRTDVNDTTTYTYYSDTSFTGEGAAAVGHFLGDLATVTNAAGKVTSYGKYNKHGQVLESTDPNGVLTSHTYDLRQRLLSTTVGTTPNAQTTSYQYDPVGQLKRVTLPDQSWIGYDYDDAHRQVAVYDSLGNRTDYQLDNAGNRTGETTKDPSGALKRQLSRSIDALGRVQQMTGRE